MESYLVSMGEGEKLGVGWEKEGGGGRRFVSRPGHWKKVAPTQGLLKRGGGWVGGKKLSS